MFCIIDLRENPPVDVPDTDFETVEECINWLNLHGDIISYTIREK